MKKLLVLLALVLTSAGCYSQSAGKELEEFVEAQSAWNDWIRDHDFYVKDSGIDPEYVKKLQKAIEDLCLAAKISPAECDKFDPGEGDKVPDPPDPPKWRS